MGLEGEGRARIASVYIFCRKDRKYPTDFDQDYMAIGWKYSPGQTELPRTEAT